MNKEIGLNNLTATEFLNEINKKREELINRNIINKTNSTIISENEQPYKIPAEWLWVRLGDIGEIGSSKRVHQAQWREEGIPFIRARDIVKLNSNEQYNPELFIEEELYNEFKEKFGVPKINDILITGVGTIGESYIIQDNNPFYFKDGNIIWFKNYFNLEPKFIKYYLDFPKTKLMIQNMSGGTTVATYTISGASSTPVPFPPLKEQQKITEILSSVDGAIEKTEQVIAKTEEVKKGLMQQLLTKGIGHTEFKQTEIGEIPLKWEAAEIGTLIQVQGGYAFKSKDAVDSGIRWFKIANVSVGNIKWDDVSYLPTSYSEIYKDYLLKERDFVVALTRPILNNELKIAQINKSDMPALLNQRVGRIRYKKEVNPRFIYYVMTSKCYIDEINSRILGTDPPNVSPKQLESILIQIPSIEEQLEIVAILENVDNKIKKEEDTLFKLNKLKQGLMQQLLTGQVRVKVD